MAIPTDHPAEITKTQETFAHNRSFKQKSTCPSQNTCLCKDLNPWVSKALGSHLWFFHVAAEALGKSVTDLNLSRQSDLSGTIIMMNEQLMDSQPQLS